MLQRSRRHLRRSRQQNPPLALRLPLLTSNLPCQRKPYLLRHPLGIQCFLINGEDSIRDRIGDYDSDAPDDVVTDMMTDMYDENTARENKKNAQKPRPWPRKGFVCFCVCSLLCQAGNNASSSLCGPMGPSLFPCSCASGINPVWYPVWSAWLVRAWKLCLRNPLLSDVTTQRSRGAEEQRGRAVIQVFRSRRASAIPLVVFFYAGNFYISIWTPTSLLNGCIRW